MPRLDDRTKKPPNSARSFSDMDSRDIVSMRCKDILVCANRRLPLAVHIARTPSQEAQICLDILEKDAFGGHAWTDGEIYWILINKGLIASLSWLINDLFDNPEFARIMNLRRFSETELIHVRDMAFRMSVEACIQHELGHIISGHSHGQVKMWREDWGEDSDKPNWFKAKEFQADDVAAAALAFRTRHYNFYTTEVTDVVRGLGELPMIMITLIGTFAYFAMIASLGRTEEEVYPSLSARIRYFYMVFQECLDRDKPKSDTSFSTFFPATLAIIRGFEAYYGSADNENRALQKEFGWILDDDRESQLLKEIGDLNVHLERFMPTWEAYQLLPTLKKAEQVHTLGNSQIHLDLISRAVDQGLDPESIRAEIPSNMPENPLEDLIDSVSLCCDTQYSLAVKEGMLSFAEPILIGLLGKDERPEFQYTVRKALIDSAVCISQISTTREARAEWLLKAGFNLLALGKMGMNPVAQYEHAVQVFFSARETILPVGGPLWIAASNNEGVARLRLAELGVEAKRHLETGLKLLRIVKDSGIAVGGEDWEATSRNERLILQLAATHGLML